ncbi:hypothetical protein LCGC14_0909700 [marine sediment metagenome]|uniref:Uncharacterized protein n=1 Tax=marine sediment metagenome TaxID=412755 RepID=A0A0F9PEQ8_9ZZZZ
MSLRDPEARQAYNRKWYLNHQEERKAYAKAWVAEHLECVEARQKAYDITHRQESRERRRKWRELNPEKVMEQNRSYLRKLAQKERNQLNKTAVLSHYSNPTGAVVCNNCGELDIDVLCIDHIKGGGAKHIAGLHKEGVGFYTWLIRSAYPEGYQALCFNCNMKKAKMDKMKITS